MEHIFQFSREKDDSYRSRHPGSNLGQWTEARTILTIPVRTVVRRTMRSAVRPTRTNPPLRTTREMNGVLNFRDPTTDLSSKAYQWVTSTARESILALDEGNVDHNDSYITVATTTEVPRSDRDEEQIIIIN